MQGSNPIGFGGQYGYYTDLETGLVLMTNRYYDPGTGRFLTRDPIGYGGGINLYGFVGNNPVTGADPEGTDGESLMGRFGRWLLHFWAPTLKPGTPTLQTPHPELQSLMDDPTTGGLIAGYGSGVHRMGRTIRRNVDYTVGYGATELMAHGASKALENLPELVAGPAGVLRNARRGRQLEEQLVRFYEGHGWSVRYNRARMTPYGLRRVDLELSRGGRILRRIEAKVGSSPYTRMQQLKDTWLTQHQGLPPVQVIRVPR